MSGGGNAVFLGTSNNCVMRVEPHGVTLRIMLESAVTRDRLFYPMDADGEDILLRYLLARRRGRRSAEART